MPKLIILGTATNRSDAPFDDKSVEIWGVSGVLTCKDVRRVDVAFEMHPARFWKRPEILEVLNGFSGKIWMQDVYEEIPHSMRYPIEGVREAFYMPTMGRTLYLTNTISFMFALAVLLGYTEIETYGVYMEAEGEYGYQRPNCEFFLGYMHAKGIKVTLNGGDVLKAGFLYGYEEPEILPELIRHGVELEAGRKQLSEEIESLKRKIHMQEGGIKYNLDLRKRYGGY